MLKPPPAEFVESIREIVNRGEKFYITTHVGPDGDAIGTALAWKLALEAQGKTVVYVSRDGVPASSKFVPHADEVLTSPPDGFKPDVVFILDCDGTPARVASPYEIIEQCPLRVLIDHHRTSEPVFEQNWIDASEPATATMIYRLVNALGWEISAEMAAGMMCGLSTDTGHFRFANTSPGALEMAAHLVEAGADLSLTAFKLFDERSFTATQLLGLALCNMKQECRGELTYTALSVKDFASIGTGDESSENVVNYLRNIRGCRMAIIFRERRDEEGMVVRISVRADPELRADLFCSEFGGGGHAAAAGCRQRGEFKAVVQNVVNRAKAWLEEEHPPVK